MNQRADSRKKNLEAIVTQSTKAAHGLLSSHTLGFLRANKRSPRVPLQAWKRAQVSAGGFAGFLAFVGLVDADFAATVLTGLAAFVAFGLILTVLPAGAASTAVGSGGAGR